MNVEYMQSLVRPVITPARLSASWAIQRAVSYSRDDQYSDQYKAARFYDAWLEVYLVVVREICLTFPRHKSRDYAIARYLADRAMRSTSPIATPQGDGSEGEGSG